MPEIHLNFRSTQMSPPAEIYTHVRLTSPVPLPYRLHFSRLVESKPIGAVFYDFSVCFSFVSICRNLFEKELFPRTFSETAKMNGVMSMVSFLNHEYLFLFQKRSDVLVNA